MSQKKLIYTVLNQKIENKGSVCVRARAHALMPVCW